MNRRIVKCVRNTENKSKLLELTTNAKFFAQRFPLQQALIQPKPSSDEDHRKPIDFQLLIH